jgi:hypothetical protein
MLERNIGIIGDGATDIAIFQKISECILSNGLEDKISLNYIDLKRQTIYDHVDRYCREANKVNNVCYLTGEQASHLKKSVTGTLFTACKEFESEMTRPVGNQDILLLTADTEIVLSSPDDYFKDWRFSICKILAGSVEEFYRAKAREGYTYEYLPLVIPVVTFPSTEILIAAARDKIEKEYGRKPNEWKQILYGTDNLATLREEDLKDKALDFITPETIGKIFQNVPESRTFIQTLSFGKYAVSG